MVACLSSTPPARRSPVLTCHSHAIFTRHQQHHHHHHPLPKWGSREALILLHNCTNFNHLKLIHARIIRHGLFTDQILVRKLIHICSSFNEMDYAALVFHQLQNPHTFTWNFMIRAYTIRADSLLALLLYNVMICRGFHPDKFTFPFVVKACLAARAIRKAKEVQAFAIKTGFSNDTFLFNTLMDLYLKCGDVEYGRMVFEKMRVRTVVSWTTFISGLIACGELDAASGAFQRMPHRNVVSWTALIDGYVKNQRPQEAFELFRRMQVDNVRPNEFTLVSLIKACTELGSLKLGGWVHEYALKNGFEVGIFLGTALIDMYSKCGSLKDAREVFDHMEIKSLATWNAMITSLGVHGYGEEALAVFAEMEATNVQPDAITFVGVLCACVQLNDVKQGYRFFKYMRECYCIKPILEHYSCMIELYRRANLLDELCELENSVPMQLDGNTEVALIRKSTSDPIVDTEKLSEPNGKELQCLETPTSLFQYQLQYFKWDAG